MAGTLTELRHSNRAAPLKVVRLEWTSDASGNVNGTTVEIHGEIQRIVTNPDGTAVPTASYDIVLNDEDGIDVAQGLLANRSETTAEEVVPIVETTIGTNPYSAGRVSVSGAIEPQVSNAGNAKKGTIAIYYR